MATKKRSITEQAAPKRDTPKRITKNTRPARSLSFDSEDKALLVSHLRGQFQKIFTRPLGFTLSFRDGEESLTFTSHRRLTPDSLRKHLDGLGVNQNLIKTAIETIEVRAKESFPKINPVLFNLWFLSLRRDVCGEKIKEIVAATPERLAKWERKLKEFGRPWENITLSDQAVIDITEELLPVALGQSLMAKDIGRRFRHWKKDQKRIFNGLVSVAFTYKYDILAPPECPDP